MAKILQTFSSQVAKQYPQWLPDKCREMYGGSEADCANAHSDALDELFRRRLPQSDTSPAPVETIEEFMAEFTHLLARHDHQPDIFVCTVPYLCLLALLVDLPILGYFGHPPLFLVPEREDARLHFWRNFLSLPDSTTRTVFAVSDPFLQMQYAGLFIEPWGRGVALWRKTIY